MPIIPPASATAFVVRKGQILRITDVEGGQVADFVCFNLNDRNEFLSQAGTRLHNGKVRISIGDDLYSNLNNVMFKIIDDKVGIHDLQCAPCNNYYYEEVVKVGPRFGCLEKLAIALNISKAYVPNPFNIFMNVEIDKDYKLIIRKAPSKKEDYIDLQAGMDCLVGIAACSDDVSDCNNGVNTPIKYELRDK